MNKGAMLVSGGVDMGEDIGKESFEKLKAMHMTRLSCSSLPVSP